MEICSRFDLTWYVAKCLENVSPYFRVSAPRAAPGGFLHLACGPHICPSLADAIRRTLKEKARLKDETDNNFKDAEDEISSQTKILVTSFKKLIELEAACVDTGMRYADCVAMREQETASLKKALCILGS